MLTSRPLCRWLPDEVIFVNAMVLGPTGKVNKKALRATYAGENKAA
jgi:non-ribosomal peptide synthetase component E (peptide arylation enzyme)